jgi:hypothetical protein
MRFIRLNDSRSLERQNVLQTSQVLFRRLCPAISEAAEPAAPRPAVSNCRIPLAGLRRGLAREKSAVHSQFATMSHDKATMTHHRIGR